MPVQIGVSTALRPPTHPMHDSLSRRSRRCGRATHGGFSLVELMVVMAIAALLLLAAIPPFGTMLADARVRTTAESLQNALRKAQSVAVQRSRTAVLGMTAGTPAHDASLAANGGNWVALVLPQATLGEALSIDSMVSEYSETRRAGVEVTGPALLCFDSLGQQVTLSAAETGVGVGCDAPVDATPTAYDIRHDGGSRALRVQVSLGGRVRLCDAAKTLSVANPDGC